MRTALNIPSKQILCTSVEGHRLPVGVTTDNELKLKIHQSQLFIALISTKSIKSHYVLFELGARWGADRSLFPLITDVAGKELLKGPLSNINALECYVEAQVHQFILDIGNELRIEAQPVPSYVSKVKKLVELCQSRGAKSISTKDDSGFTIESIIS